MSVNPPEGTLTIENSHLDVKGNVSAVALKLGTLRLTPSYGLDAVANVSNSTTHTLELSNATTGLVTTSNVVVGGRYGHWERHGVLQSHSWGERLPDRHRKPHSPHRYNCSETSDRSKWDGEV
jgi:hypothetical protein